MAFNANDVVIAPRSSLEQDPAVIYWLDQELRIVDCNEAWDRFALENRGYNLSRQKQLGRCIMDVIPFELQPFFEDAYRTANISKQPFEHSYECSSASLYRTFRMTAHPNVAGDGYVVVNSLSVERPHSAERTACEAIDAVYQNQHGITTMCCHCHRTRVAVSKTDWHWVPEYVERLPVSISHTICAVCLSVHYPQFFPLYPNQLGPPR